MRTIRRVGYGGVALLLLLLLGGCGFVGDFGRHESIPTSDDIWIEAGLFGGELSALSLGREGGDGARYVPGQLIVKLRPGKFTDAGLSSMSARHQVQVRGRINRLRIALVTLPPGADLGAAQATLRSDADVESVGLNYVYELFGGEPQTVAPKEFTNDPLAFQQWGNRQIGLWKLPSTVFPATAPIVAVVDTGVDRTHPDLAGRVLLGPDYFDGDMDPMDTWGHGTHVAGIAAAINNNIGVAGVSGRSRVLAVRVGEWWITVFAGAAGIVFAADFAGVRVINLSWGGYMDSEFIRDAVAYAVGRGILVVAAAGNDTSTWLRNTP